MVRLAPIDDLSVVKEWSARPELAEFFRRHSPAFLWNAATFATSYFICLEDEKVGIISIGNYSANTRSAEFGIAVLPRSDRRSLATAAIEQVGDYVFNYLGCNKLFCLVLPHREDLKRVLTSHGFAVEGVVRDNVFWQGRFQDEVLLSMLKKEYDVRQPKEATRG